MEDPKQRAIKEVFAKGDLVYSFKDCFTKTNFAFCKTALRFAKKNQMDIKPVAVRANVDLLKCQRAMWSSLKLRVCDIEWPARLDPTFDMYSNINMWHFVVNGMEQFEGNVERMMELNIMAKMLETHAADLRRLKIHMALDVELPDDFEQAPRYKNINNFLKALAKCTAIKSLTIVQSDHVEKNAAVNSVQLALFKIIKTMQLEILDFNGNMTIDAGAAEPASAVLTLLDYIPPSLRKLIVRDGVEPRMFKWYDDGFSYDLKCVMSNNEGSHELLKDISLPSSFWGLSRSKFNGFMSYLNANHITHIGFSDAFELNKKPTAQTGGGVVRLSRPKYMIHYVIAELDKDMVIDLRGGGDAERVARIQFAMQITTSSVIQPIERSDGGGYTTITLHKKYDHTVQVLI